MKLGAESAVELLTTRNETLAVAESLTGGALSVALSQVAGSGEVFTAGVVAYTPEMKTRLVSVPAATIHGAGVVSGPVAAALAAGVAERCGTDWGIGLTGAAGPDGHGGARPGTVWISVSGPSGRLRSRDHCFDGDPSAVCAQAVDAALTLLIETVRAADG